MMVNECVIGGFDVKKVYDPIADEKRKAQIPMVACILLECIVHRILCIVLS